VKPTPERSRKEAYPALRQVPIRFADIDMFRHLNNVAAGQFYEEARFEMIDEAMRLLDREARGAMVVANVDTAYLGQARYPGTIEVATGVAAVGRTSVTLGQALFFGDACISMADTVIIHIGKKGAAPMPAVMAEHFEGLRIGEA
jgi:acyl-CoA thioester hydrolase